MTKTFVHAAALLLAAAVSAGTFAGASAIAKHQYVSAERAVLAQATTPAPFAERAGT